MEVKINREIRNYTESIFFGLSLRQFIFSIFACGVAVLLYFLLRSKFDIGTLSWMCILGAAPFAALGFLTYNGMTAEKFIWAWIKSEVLTPRHLTFKPTNFYYELMKDKLENKERIDTYYQESRDISEIKIYISKDNLEQIKNNYEDYYA